MVWGGRREGGSGLGTCVHPWWIHVDVWQNHYNIIKQKKKNNNNKIKKKMRTPQSFDFYELYLSIYQLDIKTEKFKYVYWLIN